MDISKNYTTIQGWMVSDLKLKGNNLIIYAIIYGFTQDENTMFTGSLNYLSTWTNSTKRGVMNNLKNLEEKGLIVKKENFLNGVKHVKYCATKFQGGYGKKFHTIEKSSIGGMEKSSMGMEKSSTNNIEYNIDNNNIESISSAKPPCEKIKNDFKEIWKSYRQKCKDQEREGCEGGKKEAFEKYKANLKKHKHEEIKQAVENYAELCLIKNTFLKNLSTFLTPSKNQVEEWKDGSENEEVLKEAQKHQNNARGFNNNKNTYGSIGRSIYPKKETDKERFARLRKMQKEKGDL
jgi:hypothetical protein